jgi:nicotinate-nucleotide adenylyltransferase
MSVPTRKSTARSTANGSRSSANAQRSSRLPCGSGSLPSGEGAIGVLGGTFDPVHNGHLAVASFAADYFRLSKILLIPSGHPPHKPLTGASAEDRLAMLRLAVGNDPSFKVCESEFHRKGISYSFDTISTLKKVFPGRAIHFIIGSDNLRELPSWHRFRELLDMVRLCVTHRPGFAIRPPFPAGTTVFRFPSPEWGISATLIRDYLSRGLTCRHLVPEAVREYIVEKKLYTLPGRLS